MTDTLRGRGRLMAGGMRTGRVKVWGMARVKVTERVRYERRTTQWIQLPTSAKVNTTSN